MGEVLWRRLGYMLSPQLDIYRHIAKHLQGEKVLDVGFGTGFGTIQLTRTAKEVVGVEIDKGAVDFACRTLPGVDWEWGDISRGVDYVGRDFDSVIMVEVLEHVVDWREALENVKRVLKPDGKLIISALNSNADLRKNDLHEREWTAQEFVDSLHQYFEVIELYDYSLTLPMDTGTHQTPLVAIAYKK